MAEKFRADEAERIGLVSKVLPDEELLPYVRSVADRLAAYYPSTKHSFPADARKQAYTFLDHYLKQ